MRLVRLRGSWLIVAFGGHLNTLVPFFSSSSYPLEFFIVHFDFNLTLEMNHRSILLWSVLLLNRPD